MDEFLGVPVLDISTWIQNQVDAFVHDYRPLFQILRYPIERLLAWFDDGLMAVPPSVLIIAIGLIALYRRGVRFALFSVLSMFLLGWLGLWSDTLQTVSIVVTAVLFAMAFGIPVGIFLAESRLAWSIGKPVLDVLQTTPSFVYLVPVVMLFGIGTVPGTIATLIFATPPLIKLTQLGIAKVPIEATEAGNAFGASRLQLLRHVKIPLALDTIRAGLNQTILLSIVMSSIAAMIGAEGLGLVVLRGISRLDVGMATTGGLGLILVALLMDGLTQAGNRVNLRRLITSWPSLRSPVASNASGHT